MASTTLTIAMSMSNWGKKNKDHKATIKKHVCALLNNKKGGNLVLQLQPDENMTEEDITRDNGLKSEDIVRAIEQIFHPSIGTPCVSTHLTIGSEKPSEIVLKVKGFKPVCSLNLHLYLPTETQVMPVRADEFDAVKDILNINKIVDVTDALKSAPTTEFKANSPVGFNESKTVQFKNVKSEKTEGNDLGSRIINNKCLHYVSAFANSCGGRLYVGIDKNGCVVGERITETGKRALERKLEHHVNNMQWPEYCKPLQLGKQWRIDYEKISESEDSTSSVEARDSENPTSSVEAKDSEDPTSSVEETKSEEASSNYVIIITVFSSTGGVFVKKPESYHIVDGKVQEMEFVEWRDRLLYPDEKRIIHRSLSKCAWSSPQLRRQCDALDGQLLQLINFGKWEDFERLARHAEPGPNDEHKTELELVLLSKWYVYHYRKGQSDDKSGDFREADNILERFKQKENKAKDRLIFHVRGRLILSALQRTRGQHEESYRTARDCLSSVENLSPCILTAEFYVHFATMLTIVDGNKELKAKLKGDLTCASFKEEAVEFYYTALEHLRCINYVPTSKADMEQKTYINLAIQLLGCSLSGDVVDHVVEKEAISAAASCLKNVDDSVKKIDGTFLTNFRSCHLKFAHSSLYYRRSQHERDTGRRMALLENAMQGAEEVEFLADKREFYELRNYARKHAAVYKKELEQLKG